MSAVKVVRVYLSEDSPLLSELYQFLHSNHIRGATIFRGVKGFGESGKERESNILDFHFKLPLILEFFDQSDKIDKILENFNDRLEPGRVLSWFAELN